MSQFIENMTKLMDRIRDAIVEMSPRDRLLLGGLVGGLGLAVLVAGFWWMDKEVSEIEAKIAASEATHQTLQTQIAQLRTAEAEVAVLEKRLSGHSGNTLASFIERTTKTVKVDDRLSGMSSRQSTRENDVETSRYAMTLKSLTLEELVNFLYAVETADYPVRIETMKVNRSKKDDQIVLSPTLELSAFSLISDGNGAVQ